MEVVEEWPLETELGKYEMQLVSKLEQNEAWGTVGGRVGAEWGTVGGLARDNDREGAGEFANVERRDNAKTKTITIYEINEMYKNTQSKDFAFF